MTGQHRRPLQRVALKMLFACAAALLLAPAASAHPGHDHGVPHVDVIGGDGALVAEPATPEQASMIADPRPNEAALGGSAPAKELAAERTKSLKVRLVGGLDANFDQVRAWLLDPVHGMQARYAASGGRWITWKGRGSNPAPDFQVVRGGTDGCAGGEPEIVREANYDVTLSIYMGPACGAGAGSSGLGGGGGAMVKLGLTAPRNFAVVLAAHESGHAIGLSHASEWKCYGEEDVLEGDGTGGTCSLDEYGNASDFMGSDWTDESMTSEITMMTGNPAYVPADRIADVRSTTEIRIAGAWPAIGTGTALVPVQVRSEPWENWNDGISTTAVTDRKSVV